MTNSRDQRRNGTMHVQLSRSTLAAAGLSLLAAACVLPPIVYAIHVLWLCWVPLPAIGLSMLGKYAALYLDPGAVLAAFIDRAGKEATLASWMPQPQPVVLTSSSAPSNTSWLSAMAVDCAITSRENRLSSMPGKPWVTPSHIAGTPPATCTVAPRRRASARMRSG